MDFLLSGYFMPHPPIMIPEIGGNEIKKVEKSIKALQEAAKEIKEMLPETIVIITPHGQAYSDDIAISTSDTFRGDFSSFGYPEPSLEFDNDTALTKVLLRNSNAKEIDTNILDHGALVPLYFINKECDFFEIVHISVGFEEYENLYSFGETLRETINELGRNAVVIASGDLSHRLTKDAPAGFNPKGKEFDEKFVNILKKFDSKAMLGLDKELIEDAGECGLKPAIILMGVYDNYNPSTIIKSYEGPFGVGYCVASILKENPYVNLAKETIEKYLEKGEIIKPKDYPLDLDKISSGAFVSIKKYGELRGCIGTISPTRETLAEEIADNAVNAAFRDPRFPPIEKDELNDLEISVDILKESEPISSIEHLDVKKYGVIVRKGVRSGLLLPNLEGVDTPEEQVSIALQKAGISLDEEYEIERFEVERHK